MSIVHMNSGYALDFSKFIEPCNEKCDVLFEDLLIAANKQYHWFQCEEEAVNILQHQIIAYRIYEKESGENFKPAVGLTILFHDMAECFTSNVSRPMKKLLPEYCRIEDNIQKWLESKFIKNVLINEELIKLVKHYDLAATYSELGSTKRIRQMCGNQINEDAMYSALFIYPKDNTEENIITEYTMLYNQLYCKNNGVDKVPIVVKKSDKKIYELF